MMAWVTTSTLRIAGALLLLAACCAHAADWRQVRGSGNSAGKVEDFIDYESIYQDGNNMVAWTRIRFPPTDPLSPGGEVHEILSLLRFDCEGRTMSIMSAVSRGADGRTIAEQRITEPSKRLVLKVTPGTALSEMWGIACARRTPQPLAQATPPVPTGDGAAAPAPRAPAPRRVSDPPDDAMTRYTWQYVTRSAQSQARFFVATESIEAGERQLDGMVTFLLRSDSGTPPRGFAPGAASYVSRRVVHCVARTVSDGVGASFDGTGRLIERVAANGEVTNIAENSVAEAYARVACGNKLVAARPPAAAPRSDGAGSGAAPRTPPADDPPADAISRYTWQVAARGETANRMIAVESIVPGTGARANWTSFLIRVDSTAAVPGFRLRAVSFVFRNTIDCAARRILRGDAASYDAAGRLVERVPGEPGLEDLRPNSVGEIYSQVACGNKWAGAPAPPAVAERERGPGRDGGKGAPAQKEEKPGHSFGTAWLSDSGYLVTAAHVVDGGTKFSIVLPDKTLVPARLVNTDSVNDLAILVATLPMSEYRGLALSRGQAALGASVFTLGFPIPDMLGIKPKFTSGEISSTAGMGDDPRILQISTPVQPGNSGGPLINRNGEVVGVISSKLNAAAVAQATGDIPQNVNYAVKARYLQGLLTDAPARAGPVQKVRPGSLESLAAQVNTSVFLLVVQ